LETKFGKKSNQYVKPELRRLFEAIKSFIKLTNKVLIISPLFVTRRLLDINLFVNQTIQKNYLDVYLLNFLIISGGKGEESLVAHGLDYNSKCITVIDTFNLSITPDYPSRFVAAQLVIGVEF
jgi:hypothetical protein